MSEEVRDRKEIVAVDVFLERRKSKEYVGRLGRSKNEGRNYLYEFVYDPAYLQRKNAIPLGPEFPLIQERFTSRSLFSSFEDRIPSKKNPAYPEYCKVFGISPDETNPLILLSTIGRRGPSSFVFEPVRVEAGDASQLRAFRKELDLTIREFAAAFDVAPATIQKVELGKGEAKEALKRLRVYMQFPEVALWEVRRNRARIHDVKYRDLVQRLEERALPRP